MNDRMAEEAAAVIRAKGDGLPAGCWKGGLWIGGIIAVAGFYSGLTKPVETTSANTTAPSAATTTKASRGALVATTDALDAKIEPLALEPLDPKYDRNGYRKLGKRVWGLSNDFRRWAALSVAQSSTCDRVSTVAVWERATRDDLRWHVGCENGERFIVSERQARNAKAQFDPKGSPAERDDKSVSPPQSMSAVWANFSESGAVAACESLIKDAAVNRKSFETTNLPNIQRDEETSRATIYRDFSSDNAMGGTITGKYKCVVDASGTGRVLTVKTRDAFGVHVIFDRL